MSIVPLFPLPNIVLFPQVPLPLHVFEPRYRALVQDALESHRTIGIVLLKPGYEADYHGRPDIYPIGCTGSIVGEERLDDGRYNLLLQGQRRFRVVAEEPGGAYRVARVEELAEPEADDASVSRLRDELLEAVSRLTDGSTVVVQGAVAAATVVNALCQGLDLPAVEKLDLLACESVDSRAKRLLGLLEFHRLERTAPRSSAMN